MSATITLATLNAAPADEFVATLGGIFEHSPWVAEASLGARPFATTNDLLQAMVSSMLAAPHALKLDLIRAHPDLAGRLALKGELTQASTTEQASAGLDQCSPEELERFQSLNDAYKAKFDFPFILAVKGRGRAEILAAFEQRLAHDEAEEFDTALRQIAEIARLRLTDLIKG